MKILAVKWVLVVCLLAAAAAPLAAASGALKVTSFPSGAAVVVDGVSTGKVTPMSVSLPEGDHVVTVTIPGSGWNPDTRTVTITPGNNDLSVTLVPTVTAGPKGDKGDTGAKGDKGDKSDKGDAGAKGDTGDKGDKGGQGDKGDTGQQGIQGLQGPAGTPGTSAPAAPPLNYSGTFRLQFDANGATIRLTTVGGCFDKLVDAEYEDCYLSTSVLSPELLDWLHDSIIGAPALRDVTLIQINTQTLGELSRTSIGQAFIRDFAVSDFDASTQATSQMSFVLVPRTLQSGPPSTSTAAVTPFMRTFNFSVEIPGISQPQHISQVSGLHVSFGKIQMPPNGPRHQFRPGATQFDNISIDMTLTGTTDQDFDTWAQNISNGQSDNRTGVIHALDQTLQNVVQDITLFDLSPVAFPTFVSGTRRTAILSLARFEFQ